LLTSDTVGYGRDADAATLQKIAALTGGGYWAASTFNAQDIYRQISANAKNQTGLLSFSDILAPGA
jgi:hypothetical protein